MRDGTALKFEIVQIEALAQGATVWYFYYFHKKISCPGQLGNL